MEKIDKIFKKNIYLSVEEYFEIKYYLDDEEGKVNIVKEVSINDGDDTFNFKITIKSKSKVVFIEVILEENPVLKNDVVNIYSDSINCLMGVMECKYKATNSEDINYCFYFNIDTVYDNKYYFSKSHYYRCKLGRLKACLEDVPKKAYSEMIYTEFNKEQDIVFATYLVCPSMIFYENKMVDLYEKKLFYVGIELENYKGIWKDYKLTEVIDIVRNASQKEILELILAYASFLKGNREKYGYLLEINEIGYVLYDAYIRLLED